MSGLPAKPVPPEKPLPSDCCDSGCDRCVHDIYAEELAHYEQRLAAWQAANCVHGRGANRRQSAPCG